MLALGIIKDLLVEADEEQQLLDQPGEEKQLGSERAAYAANGAH